MGWTLIILIQNTEGLLIAGKETDQEVNVEKTKHVLN
jgi:hypothetical protein